LASTICVPVPQRTSARNFKPLVAPVMNPGASGLLAAWASGEPVAAEAPAAAKAPMALFFSTFRRVMPLS
jgi:hypothetical protein